MEHYIALVRVKLLLKCDLTLIGTLLEWFEALLTWIKVFII